MRDTATPRLIAALPIERLPEGDVCPPLEPEHATWNVIAPWEDPLASRGGYRDPSCKARVTVDGQPALEWSSAGRNGRALVIGRPSWRDLVVTARVQTLPQAEKPIS